MYEVTLKDIAEVVGCSVNTVSLALKNSPRISEATRNKVQKAAKEMNYASNNMARALVLKRTGTIGLVIRNISSLLLTSEARCIEQYLEQNGYTMYVIASHDDLAMEEKAINLMLSNKVDGLILNTKFTDNLPKLERLRAQGFPVVLLSGFDITPKIDAVYPNLVKGAYIATKHLLQMGHKRVIFVAGEDDEAVERDPKYTGYSKALKEAGIEPSGDMVCRLGVNDFNLAGDEALGNLLRKGKTEHAFLVTQDELAIPVIKFLDKNGVMVPQELAVASLDNIRFAETALVPLTTVGFDLRYISHHAIDILLEIINGTRNGETYEDVAAEPEFYIRESCGYYQI